MSRRHKAEKRDINPDPKFGDLVVSKFMNNLMYEGKKSVAEGIVYGAFEKVQAKVKSDPVQIFHQALENVARPLKSAHAAWVVQRTRFRLKCAPSAARPWPSAGSSSPRAAATKTPWLTGFPANSWMPPTTVDQP